MLEKVDVCVCGARPAGVSAAIAAARQGATTRLIDVNGCCGGIWTAELLSWIWDYRGKAELIHEITKTLEKRGHAYVERQGGFPAEIDKVKLLLDELCLDAGVRR